MMGNIAGVLAQINAVASDCTNSHCIHCQCVCSKCLLNILCDMGSVQCMCECMCAMYVYGCTLKYYGCFDEKH